MKRGLLKMGVVLLFVRAFIFVGCATFDAPSPENTTGN